jgi:hypothetical protein
LRPLTMSTALVLTLCLGGCSLRAGMNHDCEWPSEPASAVDVRSSRHLRHLIDDVRVAEELGIRYSDATGLAGRPSSAQRGMTLEECNAKLFNAIAHTHSITSADVLHARERLDALRWDPAIHLPLAGFFVLVTFAMARWIRNRFSRDEKPAAIVATLFVSATIGGLMLALGHLWGGVVEMIRVGDMHLSYRTARLGWRHYSAEVLAAAVMLFWVVVLLSYRLQPRDSRA